MDIIKFAMQMELDRSEPASTTVIERLPRRLSQKCVFRQVLRLPKASV